MQDELDKNLKVLFEQRSRDLPEEPFFGNMLKLIERRRAQQVFMRRLAYVLGFACCVLLSPLLIKGSVVLSGGIDTISIAVGNLLNTSTGMFIAALGSLLFLFYRRRHISKLV
jgi:hypothetical protein